MKTPYLIDLIFIIVLAGVLVIISEMGLPVKIGYLFIPFLVCYYIGRYASYFINKAM
jgi:predicted membrane protein